MDDLVKAMGMSGISKSQVSRLCEEIDVRVQTFLDSTFWPKISGNCHAHRETEQSIVGAGFQVADARRVLMLPGWVPLSEAALGRAVRPA